MCGIAGFLGLCANERLNTVHLSSMLSVPVIVNKDVASIDHAALDFCPFSA
jgi:hypothetical protein